MAELAGLKWRKTENGIVWWVEIPKLVYDSKIKDFVTEVAGTCTTMESPITEMMLDYLQIYGRGEVRGKYEKFKKSSYEQEDVWWTDFPHEKWLNIVILASVFFTDKEAKKMRRMLDCALRNEEKREMIMKELEEFLIVKWWLS